MPRNVEIKAKLENFDKTVSRVASLCESNGLLLSQEDTFFKVPHGRLKLRTFKDGTPSQLISYTRPNRGSPKISDYSICTIENCDGLLQVLKSSLDVIGTVKKERRVFLYGQTRIHLDQVEGLGDFLELEVVLNESQNLAEGEKIVYELLEKLEISDKDFVTGAYLDLQ